MRAVMARSFADAAGTWRTLLGTYAITLEAPHISFVPKVKASHCYGLYVGAGPVYCTGNSTVFVSIEDLQSIADKLDGVPTAGYVFLVAHELAHHVQKVVGRFALLSRKVRGDPAHARTAFLKYELEADCLAGVWAAHAQPEGYAQERAAGILSAIDVVGDDKVQQRTSGIVDPNTFTHGSSEQRARWFMAGFNARSIDGCDVLGREQF